MKHIFFQRNTHAISHIYPIKSIKEPVIFSPVMFQVFEFSSFEVKMEKFSRSVVTNATTIKFTIN